MSKRYLMINADDFGSCHAANEAIERLFNHGFITSTTLMTPCPWAEDAARRAQENPKINVGLHITTTAEYEWYKWGPVDKSCQSLTDERGYFYSTAQESLAHATAEDMEKEIRAQYAWMESRGVLPTQVDSHMGTVYGLAGPHHMEPVLKLCAEKGLNFRLPKRIELFVQNPPEELAAMAQQVIQAAAAMRVGLPDVIMTCDYDLGEGETYEGFKRFYMGLIEQCPEGITELFVHPCIESPEVKAINGQWQKRVWEYELMRDDEVLKFIQKQGIELTTYAKAPFFA